MQTTEVATAVAVDPEVRALVVVLVRTLRYVARWLERRYLR